MSESDFLELNRLAYRYAAAVDSCDVDAFLAVFEPAGRLRTYHPDAEEPFIDFVGHEQLGWVPQRMQEMWRRTVHQMTNHLIEIDGDSATGTLLCSARHLRADPDDQTVLVIVIRYVDVYDRRAGPWRISDRQIRFLWSERHPVVDSGL